MKALIVGLGSMGRRRARLLKRYFPQINISGVDFNLERRSVFKTEYNENVYESIDSAIAAGYKPDIAFVCASPLAHANIIKQCLECDMHIFSEIDLVTDGYEENINIAAQKGLKMFLSSTPMYHKEIEYITNSALANSTYLNYLYHVGQYLPDWHPWENYKEFFVGDKRTNGCREILAIELPWIINAFGDVEEYYVTASKNTSLDLDYNDNYFIVLKHKNGHKGMIAVDIVCREASRKLEVFGEELYINWHGAPNSLVLKNISKNEMWSPNLFENIDKLQQYSSSIIENMYLEELKDFFEVLQGKSLGKYTYVKSKNILELIDNIEDMGAKR